MKKTIDFSSRVMEMMKFIIEQEGHKNFTSSLHSIISQYYNKNYYSKWNKSKGEKVALLSIPEDKMTEEQMCEALGGKVVRDNNGTLTCKGPIGYEGSSISAPLSLMGEKGAAGDYRIKK